MENSKSSEEFIFREKFDQSDSDSEPQEELPKLTAVEQEIVHFAYDYFGQRLVTCGADQTIKIWQKMDLAHEDDSSPKEARSPPVKDRFTDEFDYLTSPIGKKNVKAQGFLQGMCLVDEWEAHHMSPIWKVAWAHPQYGQIIASCADRAELIIWEEQIKRKPGSSKELIKEWVKQASLPLLKDKIQDIKFAPEHLGFKLLILYKTGCIQVFEAKEVSNLKIWELIADLESINKNGCNSVDWNPNEGTDMFVVASNANNDGYHLDQIDDQELIRSREASRQTLNEEKKEEENPTTLREMKNKVLQFFKFNEKTYVEFLMIGKETDFLEKEKIESENDSIEWDMSKNVLPSIFDVKFAPNFGKSYTLLATCDNFLKVSFWKLDMSLYKEEENESTLTSIQPTRGQIGAPEPSEKLSSQNLDAKILTLETSVSLRMENDEVLRAKFRDFETGQINLSFNNSSDAGNEVEMKANEVYMAWNVTGTMLAVSTKLEGASDGNILCVYKQNLEPGTRRLKFSLLSTFG